MSMYDKNHYNKKKKTYAAGSEKMKYNFCFKDIKSHSLSKR